jgi:hypothetical protein
LAKKTSKFLLLKAKGKVASPSGLVCFAHLVEFLKWNVILFEYTT